MQVSRAGKNPITVQACSGPQSEVSRYYNSMSEHATPNEWGCCRWDPLCYTMDFILRCYGSQLTQLSNLQAFLDHAHR